LIEDAVRKYVVLMKGAENVIKILLKSESQTEITGDVYVSLTHSRRKITKARINNNRT
jgi:hypothetical protein